MYHCVLFGGKSGGSFNPVKILCCFPEQSSTLVKQNRLIQGMGSSMIYNKVESTSSQSKITTSTVCILSDNELYHFHVELF